MKKTYQCRNGSTITFVLQGKKEVFRSADPSGENIVYLDDEDRSEEERETEHA
jgi:hypothetical protein